MPLRMSLFLIALATCTAALAEEVSLECSGQLSRYSPDFSTRIGTVDPYTFVLSFDTSTRKLLSGPVADPRSFSVQESADSVDFFRNVVVAGRNGREFLSVSRVSGNLVQMIQFQDAASGQPDAPIAILSADCKRATKIF